jgi:hypothetical protein
MAGAATPEPRSGAETTAAIPPRGGSGLADLVSWWDAQSQEPEAERAPAAASRLTRLPAAERTSAAWPETGGGVQARDVRATAAEGAALTARQSFRGALEEILVSEAHASGIEVRP